MKLNIQVLSLIMSLGYGIFLYLTLELNSRFIYSEHIIIKVLSSFLFVMFHTLFYFLILMYINNGYLHFYFLISILGGYLLCKVVYKRFVKGKKV